MGGCCPSKTKRSGQKPSDGRRSRHYTNAGTPPGGGDADDELRSGELSPLHSKYRPTLLGGEKDGQGLYKVPESREYLNLSCEDRTEWPLFSNVHVVKRLDLSSNKLSTIRAHPMSSLERWSNLEVLNVSANSLREVPKIFRELPSLTSLDMAGNPLRRDDPCGVLPKLPRLQVLSLADCNLDAVPKGVAACTTLTDLDLSGNRRISLGDGDGGLSELKRLTALNVSRTLLRAMPESLKRLKALHTLDLSDCPPDFSYESLRPLGVRTLMLRNSVRQQQAGLMSIPTEFSSLTMLTSLDLSGNPVRSLDMLASVPWVTTVVLRRCSLRRFSDALLQSSITSLDVSGNFLTSDGLQSLRRTPLATSLRVLNLCGNLAAQASNFRTMDVIGELPHLTEFWFDVWADKKNAREEKAVIYSSRIPAQLARPNLQVVNGVPYKVFGGTLAETFCRILASGTLKLDLSIQWEDETKQHIALLQLFHDHRQWIADHTAACIARYRMYIGWTMRQGWHGHYRPDGGEELIPPLDVLYVLYCHIIRPQYYAADMAHNNLRIINHLMYPVNPDEPWANGRVTSPAAVLSGRSRYSPSARRWNEHFAPRIEQEPWMRYEYYAADAPDTVDDPAAYEPDVQFGTDLAEELRCAMEFVNSVVEYADVLRSHWYHSSDRYLKFFAVRMLTFEKDRGGQQPSVPLSADAASSSLEEEDQRWVPTLGIQLHAHVHQCLPAQYRHDMMWYSGVYVGCEPPVGAEDSEAFQKAFKFTSDLWEETYGEEYVSQQQSAQRPWGIAQISPRHSGAPRHSSMLGRRDSGSSGSLRKGSASGLLRCGTGGSAASESRKVRFAGGGIG
eukprot:TRINITY_DN1304_c0_g2_i3.p1 TRINITY_DN1304_c0_g2~~TRINITY_DN1304_c0_g2_i3.p1  ORF type:complete len:844 (+),score=240.51 TRINITY_DN1304_c0_g2_i3:117-2648(+)